MNAEQLNYLSGYKYLEPAWPSTGLKNGYFRSNVISGQTGGLAE